jgi:cardiolipin synthase (CMP-forming)
VVSDRTLRVPAGTTGSEAPPADDGATDRLLTVPNAITVVRLACVPVFCWLLFGAHEQTAAALLLGVLGASDFADGYVARRWHQVSTVGKVLDPVADRILVVTAVISVLVVGAAPVWLGTAALLREVVVSAAVLLLASMGAQRIDVLWLGKAGTLGLMFAFPIFLLANGDAGWQQGLYVVAWLFAVPGLVLGWAAAAAYVPKALDALRAGRAHGRHAGSA